MARDMAGVLSAEIVSAGPHGFRGDVRLRPETAPWRSLTLRQSRARDRALSWQRDFATDRPLIGGDGRLQICGSLQDRIGRLLEGSDRFLFIIGKSTHSHRYDCFFYTGAGCGRWRPALGFNRRRRRNKVGQACCHDGSG
jgi:hypothetical protein